MKRALKTTVCFVVLVFFAMGLNVLAKAAIKQIYPLKYERYIFENAMANELDPYFVMAVIKAESNYNPTAHSGIARGLMQITDDTAVWIADKMGLDFSESDIENPEINIKMGCYYLKYLSGLYDDPTVVLASYNAGMGNVSKWLEVDRFSEDSKTLFEIPFGETKNYVKKVARYENVYKKLYGNRAFAYSK